MRYRRSANALTFISSHGRSSIHKLDQFFQIEHGYINPSVHILIIIHYLCYPRRFRLHIFRHRNIYIVFSFLSFKNRQKQGSCTVVQRPMRGKSSRDLVGKSAKLLSGKANLFPKYKNISTAVIDKLHHHSNII